MHFQYVVAPPTVTLPAPPPGPTADGHADLLRELIAVQREQLAYLRAAHDAQNANARWRAFLARWSEEFPGVGDGCLKALPMIERAFLRHLDELTRRLTDEEADNIEDEFSLGEFLDRFGMRLGQLGNLLNVVSPLAEAARTPE
ncbi:MAG TPA: hypothetical protein VKD90_28595 [Gemmataceae bacterium]|nr:hypothetical protein [Gemmataceae bacterium]